MARIAQLHCIGREDELTAPIGALLERGRAISALELVFAFDRLAAFRARVNELWGEYDVLLLPTSPAPAWPVELPYPTTIGHKSGSGEVMGNYCGWVNALGLPAINVPWEFHQDGRPIGVQMVAKHGADVPLLSVARDLQLAGSHKNRWPSICV